MYTCIFIAHDASSVAQPPQTARTSGRAILTSFRCSPRGVAHPQSTLTSLLASYRHLLALSIMTSAPSTSDKGKGKATTGSPDTHTAASARTVTPPRTPPRRVQLPVTPSTSFTALTPGSKRTASQARLTQFFYSPKKLRQPELTPDERKAKKEVDDIVIAVHKDADKEEREWKRAKLREARESREAERQLRREEKQTADEQRKKGAQPSKNWVEWRKNNSKPNATFKLPATYNRDEYRNVKQCKEEFHLTPAELQCLKHCSVPNTVNKEWADEKWFRLDDIWNLVGRKTAVLAGVTYDDEDELILEGRVLFFEQQAAQDTAPET